MRKVARRISWALLRAVRHSEHNLKEHHTQPHQTGMKYVKHALALFALILVGCEGPVGPAGPQGPTGPAGPQGEQGEEGAAGSFTYQESATGTTNEDGLGLALFPDRKRTDTVVVCWVDAGEGVWAQLGFDTVLLQNPDGPTDPSAEFLINNACLSQEVEAGLGVSVVTSPGTRYLIVAYGI